MAGYIFRRLISMVLTLIVLALVTFVLMTSAPGGPWDATAPDRKGLSETQQRILNAQFGLDKPNWRQFTSYVFGDVNDEGQFKCGAICGNLGPSFKRRGSMVQDILFAPRSEDGGFFDTRFSFTLRLALIAVALGIIIGIPSGIIAALKQNTWVDYLISFITTIGISVPGFVVAIFLIFIFAVTLHIIPVIPKWDQTASWIMPGFVMGFGTMASLARYTRTQMLDVMRQDYIRTARAKGLREQAVILKHMLRNSLIPVVTILGPTVAGLLTGSFIIEQLFGFPGVGAEFVNSIFNRDYSMIMGTTLFLGLLVVFANFFVDLTYGFLDPRIRLN
jgi:oligopeptide transport system permease protein